MKISQGTIIRTILLVIALINVGLEMSGKSIIPIDEELVRELVSYGFTVFAAVMAWWKNNSFTKPAIKADEYLKEEKTQIKQTKESEEN